MSRTPYEDGRQTFSHAVRLTEVDRRRMQLAALQEGVSTAIWLGRLVETALQTSPVPDPLLVGATEGPASSP